MRRAWISAAAFCAALVLPTLTAAQTIAYATYDGYTNVREGPSTRYQIIAQLDPGTEVDVLGCLETRAWCQILIDDFEGWVYARRLEFDYSGERYVVPDYYAYFGAPFVYFNFSNDDHGRYHHRRYDDSGPRFDDPGRPTAVQRPDRGFTNPQGTIDDPVFQPSDGPPDQPLVGGGGATMPDQVFPEEGPGEGGSSPCPPGDPNCMIAE